MMFEMLQLMKHYYKKDRVRFFDRWIVEPTELTAAVTNEDPLKALMEPNCVLTEGLLDRIVVAINTEEGLENALYT